MNRTIKYPVFIALVLAVFVGACSVFKRPRIEEEMPYVFPRLSRTEISLDGSYRFITDPHNKGLLKSYHLPSFNDSLWKKIRAPDTWESQGITAENPHLPNDSTPYSGYAWYRKWIYVPQEWAGRDLEINLGRIDDSEVCFWNGEKLGESKGLQFANRFTIPARRVKFGGKNLLAVRVLDTGGEGGIVNGPLTLRPHLSWDALSLTVHTPRDVFIFEPHKPVRLELCFQNPLDAVVDVSAIITIRNFDEIVVFRERFDVRLNRGRPTLLTVEMSPQPRGHYDCKIEIQRGDLNLKTFWTSYVVIGPAIEFADVQKSPFGLCGGALFHISLAEHKTLGMRRLLQHARAGAYWGRNDLWWGAIEPQKGKWDFSKADSTVSYFTRNHINLLGILCYSTPWLKDAAPTTDEEIADYANYAVKMAKHYGNQVRYWEVWNEPNILPFWSPKPDASDYARLLKATYTAVKKATPEIQIVGMVTSLTDLSFIKKVLKSGAGKCMDVLSVHPYQIQPPTDRGRGTEQGKIHALRKLMSKYDCNVPIWITECGWQTLGAVTEHVQAEYLVKFFTLTLAEGLIERIYWFNLSDWGGRFSAEGGHFGLVHSDQSPKASYAAYYTMVEQLHDFKDVRRISLPEGVYGFDFTFTDGHKVRVLWTERTPRILSVPRMASVVSLVGRDLGPTGGRVLIDHTPRYITGRWR